MLVPRWSSFSLCPLAPVQRIRTTHLTLAPFSARAPASRRKRGSGSFLFEKEEERCREGRKKTLVVILCGSTAVTKNRTGVHTQKMFGVPICVESTPTNYVHKNWRASKWSSSVEAAHLPCAQKRGYLGGHLGGHPLWEHRGYPVH